MNSKWVIFPTFLTSLNMFCGFFAITLAFSGKFVTAGWLIVLAAIFDGFDGRIARRANTASSFGIEADSLADVVSFGVAPALLLYNIQFCAWGVFGLILSFAPLSCVAFRLARFNVDTIYQGHSNDYKGLPAPMSAISIVSLVFMIEEGKWSTMSYAYLPLLLLVCVLMVSRIGYDSLPVFSFRYSKANSAKLAYVFVCMAGIIVAWQHVFFPIMLTYLLHGPIREVFGAIKNERNAYKLKRV